MARPSTSSSASSSGANHGSAPLQNRRSEPSSEDKKTEEKPQEKTAEDDNQGKQREHDREHLFASIQSPFTSTPFPTDPSLLPNGKRSLSIIGLQSFLLGIAFAASLVLGIQFAVAGYPIWRFWAFVAPLSLFHFLEYWTTAQYNPTEVRASSFLLFSNGVHYNAAQGLALTEILVSHFFLPQYQETYVNSITISVGLFLVIFGQATRSLAMATAGSNFNHTPQRVKREGHELVTSGVYGMTRHPSYFAFFWYAIGTQLLVGNKFCVAAFFIFLWYFFHERIKSELFPQSSNGCLSTNRQDRLLTV